jgi:hypothetical protein
VARGRRRTQPLLTSAVTTESVPKFEPDWPVIEAACGHALDGSARQQITTIVDRYLDEERFEITAPNEADAVEWAQQVRSNALALYKSLLGTTRPPNPNDSIENLSGEVTEPPPSPPAVTVEWQRKRDAQDRIEISLEIDAQRILGYSEMYHHLLPFLLWLSQRLKIEIDKIRANAPASFVEGRAWNKMIAELTEFAETYGIPIGVSNTNNAAVPGALGFQGFIDEIQYWLDDRARYLSPRGGTSPEAIRAARRRAAKPRGG